MIVCVAMMAVLNILNAVYGNVIVYSATNTTHKIVEEFLDVPASFGDDLPLEGLRGLLVVGEPADACTPLVKPPVIENFTGKWIVLIARYNCSFEEKVRNAQTAGYDCAIVHNVNSSDLETMSAKDPDGIEIPSVFVSDFAGLELAEKYKYSLGYYIMVNGDVPFNINTHLLLPFAIVVVLCLFIILLFMIVKCIKDRRRARRHRLPARSLKKIPICKFSKGDPYDTCAICLDDYVEGERLRVLPCAHAYHAACIDPWLTQNKRVCPVCKRRVLAAGEPRRADDSDSTDTEPLLNDSTTTQGGTFEPQSQNPFVSAARERVRALLRERAGRRTDDPEVAANSDDNDESPSSEAETDVTPLLEAVLQLGRAQRVRDGRRRRTRAARPRVTPAAPAASAAPTASAAPAAPAAPAEPAADTRPRADTHSINNSTDAEGEIGVVALPAGDSPPQVRL